MRIGINPAKEDNDIKLDNYHRIIVPVYIPNFDGYFANLFNVFKLCLESILLTSHLKTRITIYNNNSHIDVKEYIDKKYATSDLIDQVFHSKENLGKINAILAAASGNLEPLITITDADVLFKNGWQEEVEQTFLNFPEAGMIAPVPSSKALTLFTANNWFYGFFKGKLSFEKVLDPEAMHKFDLSLGNKELMYKPIHLEKYLVITNKKNNAKAVMGCGHFVATLKREVFDKGSNEPAFIKIVGGVENKFIDQPNEDLGFLRLSTKENFAFHMGNSIEDWMQETFKNLSKNNNEGIDYKQIKNIRFSNYKILIGKIILKLIHRKSIRIFILKRIGLSNSEDY